jgi:hypothetical protein
MCAFHWSTSEMRVAWGFGRLPAMPFRVTAALVSLVSGLVLAGCGGDEVPEPTPLASLTPTTTEHPAYDPQAEPAEAVLGMVPSTATTLTVTDFDTVRVQLGVPDLTSEDLMSDRSEFWARAAEEAALLTDGMLREDSSTLMLDYGFTQDDVDWEAHFTGPDGNGFVLALRPDLDLSGVTRAVQDGVGPLGGAEVVAADHLVVSGTAAEDEQVWANEPSLDGLFEAPAAATYARRGCIPVTEALGPDATAEDLRKVEQAHPLSILDDLPAFTLAFGDHLATVRTEPNRNDLFSRLDVGRDWPDPEFAAAFRNAVADPTTGRIGYELPRPPEAAALALLEELPFAICNDAVPIAEPTGL